MGIPPGTTSGTGITALERLTCISNGWDINITKMILRHATPTTLVSMAHMHKQELNRNATLDQLDTAEEFYHL